MRFMKNRIAKVLSVATSFLVTMAVTAKPSAAPSTMKLSICRVARPGRWITSTPRKPSTMARRAESSPRAGRGPPERDPGRRRELEREDGGERQERDAERPGVSRREVHDVARRCRSRRFGARSGRRSASHGDASRIATPAALRNDRVSATEKVPASRGRRRPSPRRRGARPSSRGRRRGFFDGSRSLSSESRDGELRPRPWDRLHAAGSRLMFGRTRTRFAAPWSSASCGKVDPVFRVKRCAAQEKHRMDPKVESHFWVRCASCGPGFPRRCAAQEKHRMDPKSESTFGSDARIVRKRGPGFPH